MEIGLGIITLMELLHFPLESGSLLVGCERCTGRLRKCPRTGMAGNSVDSADKKTNFKV